jgi:hypothetical protein
LEPALRQDSGVVQLIDVYNLVTEQGIEARIAALIATKKALFGGLFDGTTDSVRFESQGSFLSDVERLVAPLPDLSAVIAPSLNTDDETDADESPSAAESALDAALADELPSEESLSRSGAPSTSVRSGDPAQAARAEPPKEVAELLRALQVNRAPDGTVTIFRDVEHGGRAPVAAPGSDGACRDERGERWLRLSMLER